MNLDEFIHYSDAKHAGEFQRLHPKCKQVAYVASTLSKLLFDELLYTTSVFRKKTTDSGIHESFRAIDFKPLTSIANTYRVIEIINEIYTYDPSRPDLTVAHQNPFHGTACHIHLQVHDLTVVLTLPHMTQLLVQASKDKGKFKAVTV